MFLVLVFHSIEKAKESIFYSYNRYINGFAAVLEEDEAANVASMSILFCKMYYLRNCYFNVVTVVCD